MRSASAYGLLLQFPMLGCWVVCAWRLHSRGAFCAPTLSAFVLHGCIARTARVVVCLSVGSALRGGPTLVRARYHTRGGAHGNMRVPGARSGFLLSADPGSVAFELCPSAAFRMRDSAFGRAGAVVLLSAGSRCRHSGGSPFRCGGVAGMGGEGGGDGGRAPDVRALFELGS